MNPLIDGLQSQIAQASFVAAEAERKGDPEAIESLRRIGPPPFDGRELLEMQGLVGRYGGEFHNRPNFLRATVSGLMRGYVGPGEIARIIRANNASLIAMADDVAAIDLRQSVAVLNVPILFMLGRHDGILDPRLAEDFAERIGAPSTSVAWFEGSAHNIPFEEPDAFHQILRSFISTVSEGASASAERRD